MGEEEPLADLFSFADFARAARAKKTVTTRSEPVNNDRRNPKNPFEVRESEKYNKPAPRPRTREERVKNSPKTGEATVEGTTGLLDFEVPQMAPKPVKPWARGKRENVAKALESDERLDLQVTGSNIRRWVKVSGKVLQLSLIHI